MKAMAVKRLQLRLRSSFASVRRLAGTLRASLRQLIHRLYSSLPPPPSLKGVRIRGYTWTPDLAKPPRRRRRSRKRSSAKNNNSDFIRRRVDLIKCVIGLDDSSVISSDSTPQATIRDRYRQCDCDLMTAGDGGGARESAPRAAGSGDREKPKSRYRRYRRYIVESRQEISACLKYLLFMVNFIFWICGIACTILGIYLYTKDFRAVFEAIDFFLNPSILLIVCGCIIFIIAFLGCTGALRENVCMLKLFSLCLFFAYICLVILAFVVFMLFYSDTKTGLSIQSLLQSGVSKYHENDNMRELMDYLQTNLGCCGATSQGYKDWNNNPLYNCSPSNPTPEQCGVPPSCCKVTAASSLTVTVGPRSNPGQPNAVFIPASESESPPGAAPGPNVVTNPRCGFHAQDKSITDLQNTVYTDGCLQPLQRVFEGNAIIIGAIIGAVIVPVCLSVTFSNVLARQIERQRYLLEKEARKEERRRRRNRSKFRDPFAGISSGAPGPKRSTNPEVVILQEVTPDPAPIPKQDSSSNLIIEDDHQEAAPGPSGVTKHVKVKKRSDERPPLPGPPRKRSGNPDLPPVPSHPPPADPRLEHKKRRKDGDVPGQGQPPRVPDPLDERRRRHRRPRSKDAKPAPYSGPVIVEIESTTHDGPPVPSAPVDLEPMILTVEEEAPAVDVAAGGGSRKNSSEQAIPMPETQ